MLRAIRYMYGSLFIYDHDDLLNMVYRKKLMKYYIADSCVIYGFADQMPQWHIRRPGNVVKPFNGKNCRKKSINSILTEQIGENAKIFKRKKAIWKNLKGTKHNRVNIQNQYLTINRAYDNS